MKNIKLLISIVVVIAVVSACSSSRKTSNSPQISGTWQLQTITTVGVSDKGKMKILNEADFNCFVGSLWVFNKRNDLGSYIISKNGNECAAVKRNIHWSLSQDSASVNILKYARLNENMEMLVNEPTFIFTIVALDANTLKMKNEILAEGRQSSFTYNFVKVP